jgi:hypothetical protein
VSFTAVPGLDAAVLLVLTVNAAVGAVPRRRVEEFARLHSLPVTPENGNQIIVYRATTRRWRTAGFALGVLIPATVTGRYSVTFLWVFAGWFAGAAVAELRVAHLDRGPRASASLTPRRAADYLPWAGRWAVPGAMAGCVLSAAICATRSGAGLRAVAWWTALGLGVGAVTLAAQRHVLRRPQPAAGPDRLAADDAIRSRSMHVLAAAGMVLVGSCVGAQLAAAGVLHRDHTTGIIDAVFGIGVPILGRILAYWPSGPTSRGSGGTPSAPTGPTPTGPAASGPTPPSAPDPA